MNARLFLSICSFVVCLAMLWAVALQRGQLQTARAEQERSLAQTSAQTNNQPAIAALSPPPSSEEVHELLQLRNQVGQLRRRRDELLNERTENEKLQQQLAGRGTNASAFPANYIRRSQARLVGYNTPEDTLQSFLWALRNHDMTNFLQALTPEQSRWFLSDTQRAGTFAQVFNNSAAFIGFSVIHTQRFGDGTVEVDLELAPGLPPMPVNLQQIQNQWKISSFP